MSYNIERIPYKALRIRKKIKDGNESTTYMLDDGSFYFEPKPELLALFKHQGYNPYSKIAAILI